MFGILGIITLMGGVLIVLQHGFRTGVEPELVPNRGSESPSDTNLALHLTDDDKDWLRRMSVIPSD